MHVLIIKVSSMGDILHTLPAITDAARFIPNIKFTWVVEEAFAEIPRWHPQVRDTILFALRRWRYRPWKAWRSGEWQKFYRQLRSQSYDLVIDAQASLKSAVITRLSLGQRCGMDSYSVREYGSHLAYQKRYFVAQRQHAIQRLRCLFAQVLRYPWVTEPPDYGIDRSRLLPTMLDLPDSYLVFICNASKPNKCWPEASWAALLDRAAGQGLTVLLPWGNVMEGERVLRLARNRKRVLPLPQLDLSELAGIIARAQATVCLDTGLGHLAAALDVPSVAIYGPTHPQLAGTIGQRQIHLWAGSDLATVNHPYHTAMSKVSVDQAWQALQSLLATDLCGGC